MFSFLWWHQFVHRISRSMTFHQHEKKNTLPSDFTDFEMVGFLRMASMKVRGKPVLVQGWVRTRYRCLKIFQPFLSQRGTICSKPRFSYPRCCVALRQHIPVPSVGRGAQRLAPHAGLSLRCCLLTYLSSISWSSDNISTGSLLPFFPLPTCLLQ